MYNRTKILELASVSANFCEKNGTVEIGSFTLSVNVGLPYVRSFPSEAPSCHLSSISPKNTQVLFVILLFSLQSYVFSGTVSTKGKYNKGKVKDGL